MAHTLSCIAWQQKMKAEHDAYVAQWPDYCQHCDGFGELRYSYDPSPAGVSLGSGHMEDADPCPVCIETGHCPRCGKHVPGWEFDSLEGNETCPFCGWNLESPGCPLEYDECDCDNRDAEDVLERSRADLEDFPND
jgi:hypothetical protein